MRLKSALPLIFLVLVTWAGAAGISYAVVEITGGGPRGEQGPRGPIGLRGPAGETITQSTGDACAAAQQDYLDALGRPGLSNVQLQALYDYQKQVCGD